VIETRSVLVGRTDYDQLTKLLSKTNSKAVALLYDELDSATVVTNLDSLKDVVTMGSVVTFRDIDSKEISTVELVYPASADPSLRRISILAPVGAALIGLRVGETIEWPIPGGKTRHLEVTATRNREGEYDEH